jgi:putative transposase
MGYPPRAIDRAEAYHVFCRGNNRGQIVWDRQDCISFRNELHCVAAKFDWAVYAWCLMPNHHHVILHATQEQFSAGFQQLNRRHARRTNRRHGRLDHLFRHRPRTVQIESVSHLVGAIAYVVRNPVEAGLVEHAAAWEWSSFRATVGITQAPQWLLVDETLALLGRDSAKAINAFEQTVHSGHLPVSNTEEMLSQEEAEAFVLTPG